MRLTALDADYIIIQQFTRLTLPFTMEDGTVAGDIPGGGKTLGPESTTVVCRMPGGFD